MRFSAVILVLLAGLGRTTAGQMDWKLKMEASQGRVGHAMAYDAARKCTVLFGGLDGNYFMFSDTWTWDGNTWVKQSPPTSPAGRCFHAMATDAAWGRIVLFVGFDGSSPLGDPWEWDGKNWTRMNSATTPPGRSGQAVAYDSNRGVMTLFGGHSQGVLVDWSLPNTWEYAPTDLMASKHPVLPRVRRVQHRSRPREHAGDAHAREVVLVS